jgi:hypothetical protein
MGTIINEVHILRDNPVSSVRRSNMAAFVLSYIILITEERVIWLSGTNCTKHYKS